MPAHGPLLHLHFGSHFFEPEVVAHGMSATPFLQRAELIRVTTNPGLGLHVATTFTTALGIFNKGGAGLTCIKSFVPDFR